MEKREIVEKVKKIESLHKKYLEKYSNFKIALGQQQIKLEEKRIELMAEKLELNKIRAAYNVITGKMGLLKNILVDNDPKAIIDLDLTKFNL